MAADINVHQDGTATITLDVSLPSNGKLLKFAVYDAATRRYLTPDGWASSRKTIAEITPETQPVTITLAAETTNLIRPGTILVVEEIFINLREQVIWPKPVANAAPVIIPEPDPVVAATPSPSDEPVLAPSEPAFEYPATEAKPARKQGAFWLAACLGMILGASIVYALPRFSTEAAVRLFPQIALLSQQSEQRSSTIQQLMKQVDQQRSAVAILKLRESTLTKQLAEKQQNASVQGMSSDERAVFETERDQLRRNLQTTQTALEAARAERFSTAPTSGEVALEISQLTRDRNQLRINIADLKLGLESRDRRIAELIEGDDHPEDSAEQATTDSVELAQLNARIDEQAKTIRDLREQLGGQTQQAAQSEVSSSLWLGAAVDASGSVSVVVNQKDERDARIAAMAKCQGEGRNCEFIGIYKDACFAVARPSGQRIRPTNYWYGTEQTRDDARRKAVYECQRGSTAACSPAFSACAAD